MTSSQIKIQEICCIGAGYVGGPTMAVIADHCPNIQIRVVDLDQKRIDAWNSKDLHKLPVYEPGLDKVISRTRGRNLSFSTEINQAILNADMVFISVNTPTKTKGLGSGQASDLKWVEACARQVAKYSTGHTIVVEKSTLPVRTAETIKAILEAAQHPTKNSHVKKSFVVLSNPEFLAEGSAIIDLESPDRVLIGGEDEEAIEALANIYEQWVPSKKILRTNLWSSELSKLTANAFLAQRISSINSISALCEVTGADIRDVAKAIGTDSRIGPKFLNSSPGFGGSCFTKDILNLVYLSQYFGLPAVAEYWQKVVDINLWQQNRISQTIVKKLFGTVSGKKLAVLGFAFKANTNDTRDSPSIKIAKNLLEEGAELAIYDPKVSSDQISRDLDREEAISSNDNAYNQKKYLQHDGFWYSTKDISEAAKGSDAIILLTEWNNFKSLNWQEISSLMRKPAWVFDTRSIVNKNSVLEAGLKLWRVGDGAE